MNRIFHAHGVINILATNVGIEFDLRGEIVEDGDVNDNGQGVVTGHYAQGLSFSPSNECVVYALDDDEAMSAFASKYSFGSEPADADLLHATLCQYLLQQGEPAEDPYRDEP